MSTTTPARREVRYASLEEVVADAERLTASGATVVGNWSPGQVFDHLARTLDGSLDGFGFRASWLLRKVVTLLLKKKILRDGMSPGFTLPKTGASLLPGPVSPEEGLDHLRGSAARFRAEPQRAPHPVFETMTDEEWELLHRRHAELHMSFLVPT